MSIAYKVNIIEELKKRNISTYYIRKNNLLSQSTVTKLNNNDTSITLNNLNVICSLLNCQPGDIIEYIPDKTE